MENLNTQIAALLDAVRRSDIGKVKQLLAANVSPTQCSADGQTALTVAAQTGNVQIIQLLCLAAKNSSRPAQIFFQADTAAFSGSVLPVAPVLNQTPPTGPLAAWLPGATDDPAAQSALNAASPTPFSSASAGKVQKKCPGETPQAKAKSQEKKGHRPAKAPVPRSPVLKPPVPKPNVQSLALAVSRNDVSSVKALLKAKVSFRPAHWYDTPLLVTAAAQGYSEVVQVFIEAGASVHIGYDQLPLHAAAANGHLEVAQQLLNSGACIHSKTENGRTALMEAAAGGHFLLAELLITRGANVNASCRGETALMLAAKGKHRAVYELLYLYVPPSGRVPFPDSISNAVQLSL
ncbi:MAG: ankyrin repeat domain-containing protein [Cyanobacteria bacterium P01_D01_bin.105]